MKSIFTYSFLLCGILALPVFASTANLHKEYAALAVSQLDLNGCHLKVDIIVGADEFVKVDASQKAMDSLQVLQSDHLLTLHETPNKNCGFSFSKSNTVKITIGVKDLHSVKISGAVDATIAAATSSYKVENLVMDLNGFVKLNVVNDVHAKNLNVTVDGFSHYEGKQLSANTAIVKVDGFSSAKLGSSDYLTANADGFSKINYSGNPSVESSSHGLSRISGI